jgi:hypothetical protein
MNTTTFTKDMRLRRFGFGLHMRRSMSSVRVWISVFFNFLFYFLNLSSYVLLSFVGCEFNPLINYLVFHVALHVIELLRLFSRL